MEGMMKRSSTNPILLVILVIGIFGTCSIIAAPVDTLYVKNGSGTPGHGGYQFDIDLKNYRVVKGVSFTITDIPHYLTITNVERHVRLSNFRVKTKVESNSMKIFFMPSPGIDAFLIPGNAAIMRITVSVAAEAPGGTQAALNLAVGSAMDTSNSYINVATKGGYFWFGGKGDVRYNGVVDLFDVLTIIDIIIGRVASPTAYQRWAGDIDNNGVIDIVDVGLALDRAVLPPAAGLSPIPAQTAMEQTSGSVGIEIPQVPLNYSGRSELPIVVKASAPVSGLHLVFKIDPQKVIVETPIPTSVSADFTMQMKRAGDKLHLFFYSLEGKTLPVGENQIATIPISIPKPLQEIDAIQLDHAEAGTANSQRMLTFIGEKSVESNVIPANFTLYQNNPNPFNMSTNISYDVPDLGRAISVKLYLYNVKGQLIRKLEDQTRQAGHYSVEWNGTDDFGEIVSSGIYFYKFMADNIVMTKKLALMK
jgi:hypothetical protein